MTEPVLDNTPLTSLDKHPFLDMFQPSPIKVGSRVFPCAESLFLASAFKDEDVQNYFMDLDAGEARETFLKLRTVKAELRDDWFKNTSNEGQGVTQGYHEVLRRVLYLKYTQNLDLLKQLMETHYRPIRLVTGNTSNHWLSDMWINEILTVVRAQLRNHPQVIAWEQAEEAALDPTKPGNVVDLGKEFEEHMPPLDLSDLGTPTGS